MCNFWRRETARSCTIGFAAGSAVASGAALLTLLVIKQAKLHGPALDTDFTGVQRAHTHLVARIGGLPIYLSVVLAAGRAGAGRGRARTGR